MYKNIALMWLDIRGELLITVILATHMMTNITKIILNLYHTSTWVEGNHHNNKLFRAVKDTKKSISRTGVKLYALLLAFIATRNHVMMQ